MLKVVQNSGLPGRKLYGKIAEHVERLLGLRFAESAVMVCKGYGGMSPALGGLRVGLSGREGSGLVNDM